MKAYKALTQNDKIAPILCANSNNEHLSVFALKCVFIMKVDLVFHLMPSILVMFYYVTKCIGRLLFAAKLSAKTDEHKGLSAMFSLKNGGRFFHHCLY